jgi:sialic acid synthase SpsE
VTAEHIEISGREIGPGRATYVIAEIGINHNGDLDIAKRLMEVAADAGCDAVKFQKRTPMICVPPEQREIPRDTPWGMMTYLEYKERIEFGVSEYEEIAAYSLKLGVDWFASPWDVPSVEFLNDLDVCCHKIASASVTDVELLDAVNRSGRPVILSTGMSTMEQIGDAAARLGDVPLALTHATSTYPCPPEQLNLRVMDTLREEFGLPVGYSGHETGLATTIAAVALGACIVERHITLDRAMWGTDHAASVEPGGLHRLVRDIRVVESALGDGVKKVYDAELVIAAKLRRV